MNNNVANKKFWVWGLIILLLFIGVSMFIVLDRQEEEVVRFGSLFRALDHFILFTAKEKGFFEQQGLNVELVDVEHPNYVPVLLRGEIDYFPYAIFGAREALQGTPVKIVFSYFSEGAPFALVAQPHLEIGEIQTIGLASPYSNMHYMILELIKEKSLSAEIVFTGPGVNLGLLVRKEIDAATQSLPQALKFQDEGFPILSVRTDPISVYGLVTTENKIKNNPEEIKKMIVAMQKTIVFIKENPEETKNLLFEFLNLEKNEQEWEKIEWISALLVEGLSEEGIVSRELQELMIKYIKAGRFETLEDIERQTVTEEEIKSFFYFDFLE